jgi:hypothetical protein
MALSETVKYGDFCTPDNFTEILIKALDGHPKPPKLKYPNWKDSTDKLLEIIKQVV